MRRGQVLGLLLGTFHGALSAAGAAPALEAPIQRRG
jgi:hypothetical protein